MDQSSADNNKDEIRVKEASLPERPSWVNMTKFDVVDFPTPIDEITRHAPEYMDLVANLHRIDRNSRALLKSKESLTAYTLRDIRFALKLLSELQSATENKDGYSAVEAAYHLGIVDERMRTRVLYDARIQSGRRLWASAGRSREKNAAKTEDRRNAIRQRVADLQKEDIKQPKDLRATITEIREIVASEFEVSVRTVMRAEKKV